MLSQEEKQREEAKEKQDEEEQKDDHEEGTRSGNQIMSEANQPNKQKQWKRHHNKQNKLYPCYSWFILRKE